MNSRFPRLAAFVLIAWLSLLAASAQETTHSSPALTIYVVQRGDTLSAIASRYGMSVSELAQINGISNVSSILAGQRLLVPIEGDAPALPETHTVNPGETLGSIARLYDLSVEQIVRFNGLSNPNQIYAGQILSLLPTAEESQETETTVDSIERVPNILEQPAVVHVVRSGETLFRIATNYGVPMNDLVAANNISDPTRIFAGQQLIIPNLSPAEATAIELPEPISRVALRPLIFVEGQSGVIQIETSEAASVSLRFLDRDFPVIAQTDQKLHTVLVGIPVFTDAAIYPVALTVTRSTGTSISFEFNIRVVAGPYGTQNINVSQELASLLAPAVEEYEIDLLRRSTSVFNAERYYEGPMGLPAAAAMNSPFGTRRSYNGGSVSRYHNGVDFASAPGSPVFAAAPGRVVLADLLNIRGNTIVIDHGWGVYTLYAHLQQIGVPLGDVVRTGQTIGAAGSTGRITGPHLHWELWVNGVAVNPLQWVETSFP